MELAATPEEAMRRMIQDRGMSKKINYDSIKNLFPSQPPAKCDLKTNLFLCPYC